MQTVKYMQTVKTGGKNIGYNSKERKKHQKVTQVSCSIKKHQTINVIHRKKVRMKAKKAISETVYREYKALIHA